MKFKMFAVLAVLFLFVGLALAQVADVSGKWTLTGLDSEGPGIVRLTTSASGFQGVYTYGLAEDGYHCDIRDGKISKSGRVSFTVVCGSDELEAKVTGHITADGNTIKGSVSGICNAVLVHGRYITMTRAK